MLNIGQSSKLALPDVQFLQRWSQTIDLNELHQNPSSENSYYLNFRHYDHFLIRIGMLNIGQSSKLALPDVQFHQRWSQTIDLNELHQNPSSENSYYLNIRHYDRFLIRS